MEEYTIIQGQTMLVLLFAFLVTIISSYLLTSWMIRMKHLDAAERKPVSRPLARLRQMRRVLKLDSLRLPFWGRWETLKPFLSGEWLAPLIAWLAVLLIGLAIAGLLLGEE